MAISYNLDKQIQRVMNRHIIPKTLVSKTNGGNPSELVLILGQPGSGKSHTLRTCDLVKNGSLALHADSLRSYAPNSKNIAFDDLTFEEQTNSFVLRLWHVALEYFVKNQISFHVEATGRNPDLLEKVLNFSSNNDYIIRILHLDCHPAVSWLGLFRRVIRSAINNDRLTFAGPKLHFEAISKLEQSLFICSKYRVIEVIDQTISKELLTTTSTDKFHSCLWDQFHDLELLDKIKFQELYCECHANLKALVEKNSIPQSILSAFEEINEYSPAYIKSMARDQKYNLVL